MKRGLLMGLLGLAACGVDLADTSGALVLCTTDAECPDGICAVSGRCVSERDEVPLRLEAALATSLTTVELRFDDAVEGAGSPEDYTITPAVSVIAAEMGNEPGRVVLTTAAQAFGIVYQVTVANLSDEQGNALDETATATSFVSFLGLPSTAPPRFLSPGLGATVRVSPVHLAWTAVAGASSYAIDLATDTNFTTDLQHHDVSGALTLDLDAPRDVTYYARIRADVTAEGSYGLLRFERVNDVIYVYCESDPCTAQRSGSRTSPFPSISLALAVANVQGAAEIHVAARPGGAPYNESVAITSRGIRLRGGYDAAFSSDVPDAVAHPTAITALGTVLLVSDIEATGGDVGVEALSITATGANPRGIVVHNVNTVVLNDVHVSTADADQATVGVEIVEDRPQPHTRLTGYDSTFVSGTSINSTSTAMNQQGGSFALHGCQLTSQYANAANALIATGLTQPSELDHVTLVSNDGWMSGAGMRFLASPAPLHVHDTTVIASNSGIGGGKTTGLFILGAPVLIERSTIDATSSLGGNADGIRVTPDSLATIRNVAVISRSMGGAALRIGVGTGDPTVPNPVIADSSFVHFGGTVVFAEEPNWSLSNSILVGDLCVSEGLYAFPASLIGNALGCTTLYHQYHEPAVTDLTAIAAVNALDGAAYCGTGSCPSNRRVSGNIAITGDASVFASTAVNALDLHLANSAPAALCSSGIDAQAALCGSKVQSLVSCGGDGTDADSQARTAAYCIGYDER